MIFDVVIEIPAGSRNKYEIDHRTGEIRLDRMLFTATRFPHDYGYVKHTLSLDGDPLDALVMLDEPTFPGCIVSCRAVGMFRMVDEKGGDDKLLCVAAGDIRKNVLRDIAPMFLLMSSMKSSISSRFTKLLEPGKQVHGGDWVDHESAEQEIRNSYNRYKEHA
jgi:inorganic pyrophosphatase